MLKVAYIDDSEADRYIASESGFKVFLPDDYKQTTDYDVVVVDMLLGREGILDEVISFLKDKTVIITSGLPEARGLYKQVHCLPFITKPISIDKITSALYD